MIVQTRIDTVPHDGTRTFLFRWLVTFAIMTCGTNAQTLGAPSERSSTEQLLSREIYFGTDVIPILTKLGCNGGGCHGKATGQNGFKLSLFGFEPTTDYESLVKEDRGRRLFPAAPDRSLLLLKATSEMPHGGGRRLDKSSDDYRILREWIAQGSRPPRISDPHLLRIELSPHNQTLSPDASQQLKVQAFFSDGSSRDVTQQTVFESNEPGIAAVNEAGLVTTGSKHGLVAVMARFGEQIATYSAVVPFVTDEAVMTDVGKQLDQLEATQDLSSMDLHLLRQWRRMGIVPSPPADDTTFIRRVSIDICGTLPTAEEISEYISDSASDKRERLIDRLLDRPEYASYFALKWADILQNRGAGYSTSNQRAGTTLFAAWIRDSLEANKPYDEFVAEILTATGSQNENPPAIWYRTVRKSPEYVESVAQAFLGVRIQCAQCHHHPTERWSQADYFSLAAVFSRVGRKSGFADAEVPTNEIIFLKDRGDMRHPRTGEVLKPRPPGGDEFVSGSHDDPRISLVEWMTDGDNPFFARTMANRMWAHFLGRGIIHPIDDARSTNPPANPELLDALAQEFINSGYDIKHLIRVITRSYAYRLKSEPHAGNLGDSQTFARFYPRRMTAEVLLDAISQVLEVPTEFPGFPVGTRAIELPDENVAAHFLDVFGRPSRMSACECERVDAPALTQALELVNSVEIQRKLSHKSGYAEKLAGSSRTSAELAEDVFCRVLGRNPQPEEIRSVIDYLPSEPDRAVAWQNVLWSLLATGEFLFNH